MTDNPSLIEYPCDFPIKVMGKSHEDFIATVVTIVRLHAPEFDDTSTETKVSKGGNYVSITCTIWATSRVQLDTIYQALCDHPMVSVVCSWHFARMEILGRFDSFTSIWLDSFMLHALFSAGTSTYVEPVKLWFVPAGNANPPDVPLLL